MSTNIAYFINHYPKISHAFIRREILALEKKNIKVLRIALRGWEGELVDAEDHLEREKTKYVIKAGIPGLINSLAKTAFSSPLKFLSALSLAVRMSRKAERSLPYHLIYLAEACRILPWLREFGAQHLHAHFGTNSAEIVMLANALGGPKYSFTVHGPTEFDRPVALGISQKILRSEFVIAITSFGRSQLLRWIEHSQWPKVKVVHCGLESAYFDSFPFPLSPSPKLICLGRLVEQKGQLLLVEAAARLARKGITFELVLAGDGPMRPEIESLIFKENLQKHVRLTGAISTEKLRAEMQSSRGLVLPSFAEGLPMVIMEAMALRRPVLSTYVAGIPELVRHGQDGLLFPAGSIDALTKAMEEFLSYPDEKIRSMGDSAYSRVRQRHSIEIESEKLASLFSNSRSSSQGDEKPLN